MRKSKQIVSSILILVVLFIVVFIFQSDTNASEPMYKYGKSDSEVAKTRKHDWRFQSEKGAKWFEFGNTGNIIIAEKKTIYSLNPADGTLQWKLEDTEEITMDRYEKIVGTDYAMLCTKKGLTGKGKKSSIILNTVTGDTLWNSLSIGIQETFGQFYIPENDLLLIACPNKGKTVVALNMKTFEVVWTNNDFFDGDKPKLFTLQKEFKVSDDKPYTESQKEGRETIDPIHYPTWVSSTLIINVNHKGPFAFNPLTGEKIWSSIIKKEDGSVRKFKEFPKIKFDDAKSIVFIGYDKYLGAYSTSDGTLLWESPRFKSTPYMNKIDQDMISVHYNNLYYGLNPSTGSILWGPIEIDVDHDDVYSQALRGKNSKELFIKNTFCRIDYTSGAITTMFEIDKKYDFKDDYFYSIDKMDDGYFLSSQWSTFRLDKDGKVIYAVRSDFRKSGLIGKYSVREDTDDYIFLAVKTRVNKNDRGIAIISKETGKPLCQISIGNVKSDCRIDTDRKRIIATGEKKKVFTCYSFDSIDK